RINLIDAPTSTPSLALDSNGNLIVNNALGVTGESVLDVARINKLHVGSRTAEFAGAISVTGTSTSMFAGNIFTNGDLIFGTSTTMTDVGILSSSGFSINEDHFLITDEGNIG